MIPFIKNNQYNLIIKQAKQIIIASHSVTDKDVKHTFIYSALDKVLSTFPELTEEQEALLSEIVTLDSEIGLEKYKETLQDYCISFTPLTDGKMKKLFRKVKKLNYPSLSEETTKHLTYFSWYDAGASQKFIVRELDGKLIGIHGRFVPTNKRGICHFCMQHTDVGLLTVNINTKGGATNYKAIGNYFCVDSDKCNQEITNTEKLDEFLRETNS